MLKLQPALSLSLKVLAALVVCSWSAIDIHQPDVQQGWD
jgi:hypothetical protein